MIEAEVVIVGGGIAGCSAAFHLASHGRRVVLLERSDIASAASGQNMGGIDSYGWGDAPDLQAHLTAGSYDIFEAMQTGPQQMPVFSGANLTPEEKRDIIAYLKSLEDAPKYGGASMGALGPVSEGLFAWIVGIGACVAAAIWIGAHGARSSKKKGAQA